MSYNFFIPDFVEDVANPELILERVVVSFDSPVSLLFRNVYFTRVNMSYNMFLRNFVVDVANPELIKRVVLSA